MLDSLPLFLDGDTAPVIRRIRPDSVPSTNEMPAQERIAAFAAQAIALADKDVELLYLEGFDRLSIARAAVLGARQAGLPLILSLDIAESGDTVQGDDVLACMICLQELGLAAFGLHGGDFAELERQFTRLYPYAKLPLLGSADAQEISIEEYMTGWKALLSSGVRIAAEGLDSTPTHRIALKKTLTGYYDAPPLISRPEDAPILLSDGAGVYYLDEDFTLSTPVYCEFDMTAEILERENESAAALLFEVPGIEEAEHFARNISMASGPVCIRAGSEEVLEACLIAVAGRPLIDSRSEVEEAALLTLAAGYGAVVR